MTSNPNNPDFNYKKYSLEKLQEWVHDALSCGEASPHEIYSAIREAVREDYYYYKDHCSRASGLLELLSGHRPVKDAKWDAWEETYYPEEVKDNNYDDFECPIPKQHTGSTVSSVNLQKDLQQIRKEGGYDWTPVAKSEYYYDYTRNDPNRKNPFETKNGVNYNQYVKAKIEAKSAWNDGWTQKYYQDIVDKYESKQDKVKKWVLPVEECKDADTDETEYFVSFPDDLLEAADLKEGDKVEWVDQGDGSYLLKKVEKPMTHNEMLDAGYWITDDGFWVKSDEC